MESDHIFGRLHLDLIDETIPVYKFQEIIKRNDQMALT